MSPKRKRTLPAWMKEPDDSIASTASVKTVNSNLANGGKSKTMKENSVVSDRSDKNQVIDEEFSTNNRSVDYLSGSDTDQEESNVALKVADALIDSSLKDAATTSSSSGTHNADQQNSADDVLDTPTKDTPCQGNTDSVSRESCRYGSSCYRKNPQHRKDLAHPGDSDYVDPANTPHDTSTGGGSSVDNRPLCEYGEACYRKNPQHRRDYRHDAPKKRKARPAQIQDIASDDDGDFNESMGSDDFDPEGSESDDSFVTSDSVDSGNSDYDPEEDDDEEKKKKKKNKKISQKKKRAKKD